MNELEAIRRRLDAKELREHDYKTIDRLIESYVCLTQAVGDKNTTIRRLRKILFGMTTEKTAKVVGGIKGSSLGESPTEPSPRAQSESDAESQPEGQAGAAEPNKSGKAKGHGRNGAAAYTGAEKITVPHPSLKPGDPCPKCEDGTVYDTRRPRTLVRLVGQPPIGGAVYYLQKLRCNLCLTLFTAEPPPEAGESKRDVTVGSMIALMKYGTGVPFHREEKLQANLGIPLPRSTQWDIVRDRAERAEPVFNELICEAAQGEVVHNDDTTVKILEMMGERGREAATDEEAAEEDLADEGATKPQRRGMFTSGIVSTREGRQIALFFSGRKHAGENLEDVLAERAAERPPPIQMCDALSRNLPGKLSTIVANCLAHARRHFVDVADRFPEECCHVLESLGAVYHNDALARKRKLSPRARLEFHQAESGPVMEELHGWLTRQFDQRLVEPNSALGGAIRYMLKHWEKLTLFLRVPGAPLDNTICERILKKAILHRKNALFFKTFRGARTGDIFMSLIHTCELGGGNPFDYLNQIERHAEEVSADPERWMPWNYQATLAELAMPSEAAG
jgi:transposase